MFQTVLWQRNLQEIHLLTTPPVPLSLPYLCRIWKGPPTRTPSLKRKQKRQVTESYEIPTSLLPPDSDPNCKLVLEDADEVYFIFITLPTTYCLRNAFLKDAKRILNKLHWENFKCIHYWVSQAAWYKTPFHKIYTESSLFPWSSIKSLLNYFNNLKPNLERKRAALDKAYQLKSLKCYCKHALLLYFSINNA